MEQAARMEDLEETGEENRETVVEDSKKRFDEVSGEVVSDEGELSDESEDEAVSESKADKVMKERIRAPREERVLKKLIDSRLPTQSDVDLRNLTWTTEPKSMGPALPFYQSQAGGYYNMLFRGYFEVICSVFP